MFTQLLQRAGLGANPADALKNVCLSPANTAAIAHPVAAAAPTLRTVKLIMVTATNNNKFYDMVENANGTFDVRYGRVGSAPAVATYPVAQWDQKLREKTRKGYVDQTHLFAESSPATDASTIADPAVRGLMSRLMELASLSIFQNYVVTARQVTRKQVETAQQLLDDLVTSLRPGLDLTLYNTRLLELFRVIPRRMSRVDEHLLSQAPQSDADLQLLRDELANEQITLDVIRGQVELTPADATPVDTPPTLLDALNLTVEPVTDQRVLKLIRQMMGPDADKFDAAFSVRQTITEAAFDEHVSRQTNCQTQLLWHGSRSENWLSILRTGLVLRPANAIITGKMFGYGIYFADQFSKSLNYTSLHGSVWTNGRQQEGYLAIYEVHVGEQLTVTRHEASHMQLNAEALKRIDPRYDSVFAQRGMSLQKNEFIVYNQAQCTIRYMVRIKI